MTNKKNQKFNTASKSKGFFPIQLHRFNTDKHPIRKSAARCSAKLKANLSQQEELMAGSLPNVLQCPEREAVRLKENATMFSGVSRGLGRRMALLKFAASNGERG